jgi:hypothetical protein
MPSKTHIVDDAENVRACPQIVGQSLGLVSVCKIGFNELAGKGLGRIARDTYDRPTTIYESASSGVTNSLRRACDDNKVLH